MRGGEGDTHTLNSAVRTPPKTNVIEANYFPQSKIRTKSENTHFLLETHNSSKVQSTSNTVQVIAPGIFPCTQSNLNETPSLPLFNEISSGSVGEKNQ